MIRRGFWLTAGVVTGIYGYRRVSALGRRISATVSPAGPGTQAGLASGRTRRGAVALAIQTVRFTRDVREGMELYTARHSAPGGSTLGARGLEPARGRQTDHDSRQTDHDPRQTNHDRRQADHDLRQTNHDPRPKDGR